MQSPKYQVVKLKELPYSDIDNVYVCVPTCWIMWRSTKSSEVLVRYADSQSLNTAEMVMDNKEFLPSWKPYKANWKYSTDSYEEAIQFIKTKIKTPFYYDDIYKKSILYYNMSKRIKQLERQIKLPLNKRKLSNKSDVPLSKGKNKNNKISIKKSKEYIEDAILLLDNRELNDNNLDISTAKEKDKEGISPDKKPNLLKTSLILPAEYDPTNSKWTLKYPQNGPELTELLPGSGVYVNSKSLEICLQNSKNCNELAKSLLQEIFSENALNVCFFNGKNKATTTDNANNLIRPLLNRKATDVLLNFVVKYGKKAKWVANKNNIKNCLSNYCKKKFDK